MYQKSLTESTLTLVIMELALRGVIVPPGSAADSFVAETPDVNIIYTADPPSEHMKNLRKARGLRIFAYDSLTDFGQLVQTPRNVEHYAEDMKRTVEGLDGVLFRWKAPGFDSDSGRDSSSPMSDGIRYVGLLREVRSKLGRDKLMAVCLPIAPNHVRRFMTVLEDLKPFVHHFILSAFDGDLGISRACLVSPIPVIDAALLAYSKILRPEKIVLGIPAWATVFQRCTGIDRPFESKRIENVPPRTATVFRDVVAGYMPVMEEDGQVTVFEDAISITHKRQLVESRGLGGAAYLLSAPEIQPPPEAELIWGAPPPPRTVSMRPPESHEPSSLSVNLVAELNLEQFDQFQVAAMDVEESEQNPGTVAVAELYSRAEWQEPESGSIMQVSVQSKSDPGALRRRKRARRTERKTIYISRSEWTSYDSFSRGDLVSYGKLLYRCRRKHGPAFPGERPDLWEPLQQDLI